MRMKARGGGPQGGGSESRSNWVEVEPRALHAWRSGAKGREY